MLFRFKIYVIKKEGNPNNYFKICCYDDNGEYEAYYFTKLYEECDENGVPYDDNDGYESD